VAPHFYRRARAHLQKKDLDRAIADFSAAISLDPAYALAFNGRGNAYRAKGDNTHAMQDYNEAIRIRSAAAAAP
jgi:tetratricopeptide (TPR) repeat protein